MTDVAKINQELADLSKKLAVASNEYSDACKAAANSRSDYDVAKAKAMLKSGLKTATERQAEATITCESVMRDARISEALRDALKERIRALESVLNAAQTRASFLKAEMKLAGRDY
ncbi:MAG: hypothetical protein ABR568_18475 [Pyrinomonadaceae bacterium]